MIKHTSLEQGSLEWLMLRVGKPTASEFDNIISPTGKVRDGKMFDSYVASKLAEAWTGTPNADFNSWAMDQGHILEEEARPWLSLELGKSIEQVGFITTDDEKVGCSPDGLIGDIGVEIKSPQRTAQVKYLLEGKVPDEYKMQIHGGLFVTGFESWLFVSYSRKLPKLIIRIERDEKIQASIGEAIAAFAEAFDAGMNRLIDINGGPPKLSKIFTPKPQPEFVSELPS